MPVEVLVKRSENEWTIPALALAGRIDRHLRKLTPMKMFWYNHKEGGYYVRNADGTNQGPYYYADFSGLARMLGLYTVRGIRLPPVTVIDRHCNEFYEMPLKPELRFECLTVVLLDAKKALENAGYTVTLNNQNNITIHHPDVTAPVINNYGGEEPSQEDIDEEMIARHLAEEEDN